MVHDVLPREVYVVPSGTGVRLSGFPFSLSGVVGTSVTGMEVLLNEVG